MTTMTTVTATVWAALWTAVRDCIMWYVTQ